MLPFSATAPGLFGAYPCSPSVCADVHASVKSRLEEGDVDGLVRSRFEKGNKTLAAAPLTATGSRLLLQMSDVCSTTGESDPLAALTSLLREVGELRELRDRLLQATNHLSVDAALASVEDAMRSVNELQQAEKAFSTTLGAEGWRSVAAEVESARHLEARVRAFAGVQSKDAGSLEAALRTLQHRERERLTLVQLRNDVLGAASAADDKASARDLKELKDPSTGEPTRGSVKLVRELIDHADSMKALTRSSSLSDALTSITHMPSFAQQDMETARRRLRRLHALLLTALPHARCRDGAAFSPTSSSAWSGAPPSSSRSADGSSAGGASSAPFASSRSTRSADGAGESLSAGRAPEARPLAVPLVPEAGVALGNEGDDGQLLTTRSGEEDTESEHECDEDDASEGQRAWRRVGNNMALLTAEEASTANADAANGGAAAAGPKVPRLPLPPAPANAPAAAPSAEAPGASGSRSKPPRSETGLNQRLGAPAASARPASPRRTATSGSSSPRGSPQKPTPSTSRVPNGSKRRPPSHPSQAFAPAATVPTGGVPEPPLAAAASVCGAAAGDYVPLGLVGVGTRSVVHEATKIDTSEAHALCSLELDEASWEAVLWRAALAHPSPPRPSDPTCSCP